MKLFSVNKNLILLHNNICCRGGGGESKNNNFIVNSLYFCDELYIMVM